MSMAQSPGIVILDAEAAGDSACSALLDQLDAFGRLSAKAQGLQRPITSREALLKASHRVYIVESRGFLRVGRKALYLYDLDGRLEQCSPLCLLDFYVWEPWQRQGVGNALFAAMLQREGVEPTSMAYDRPSAKLLQFLAKHYGLMGGIQQPNRFVVFPELFREAPAAAAASAASCGGAAAIGGGRWGCAASAEGLPRVR